MRADHQKRWAILSCKKVNYFITQRLEKQLNTPIQWIRQRLHGGFKASCWHNMFRRDCTVSENWRQTHCKGVSKQAPALREIPPSIYSLSERQAHLLMILHSDSMLDLRTGSDCSQWVATPKDSFSSARFYACKWSGPCFPHVQGVSFVSGSCAEIHAAETQQWREKIGPQQPIQTKVIASSHVSSLLERDN